MTPTQAASISASTPPNWPSLAFIPELNSSMALIVRQPGPARNLETPVFPR